MVATTDTNVSTPEELQAFKNLAVDFVKKELVKNKEEHDRYPFGELFTSTIGNASEVGFYGINLPAEYGGVGMGMSALSVIVEKLSIADASMAGIIFTNAAALEIINAASKKSDVKNIYETISKSGATPLAYQSYGSPDEMDDMPAVKDKTKITGPLSYLVLGNIARYAVVPARLAGKEGFSYYLIDLSDRGVKRSEAILSLGLHACPAVDVNMSEVPCTLIGEEKEGQGYFQAMRASMSLLQAAISLGIMKGSFEEAFLYTKERYQGGRQIVDWPEIRMILANFAIKIKVGESCLQTARDEMDTMKEGRDKTAMAVAIHLGELSAVSTADGVQLLGGNGYMKDYGQEKRMRDSKQAQTLLGMAPLRKIKYIEKIVEEGKV